MTSLARASVPFESLSPFSAPPRELSLARFTLGDDEYAVLSFPVQTTELPTSLTNGEREVLRAVIRGASNHEIARERGRSVRTVANQVQAIFRKLDVHSRGALLARLSRLEIDPRARARMEGAPAGRDTVSG